MKKILLILILQASALVFSQIEKSNLDSIIKTHLKEFRELINPDDIVLIEFGYLPEDKSNFLMQNYYMSEPQINLRKMKKKVKYYKLKFLIFSKGDKLILRAIHFRIKKINNKKIEYINLMNGEDYLLN